MNAFEKLGVLVLATLMVAACGRGGAGKNAIDDDPALPGDQPGEVDEPDLPQAPADSGVDGSRTLPSLPGQFDLSNQADPTQPYGPPIVVDPRDPSLQVDPVVPAGPCGIEIFIRGVNQGAFASALLGVADLKIAIDGQDVPLTLFDGNVDLGIAGQQYRLTSIAVPLTARALRVYLAFDVVGAYVSGASAGPIAAGNVLEFEVPIRVVSQNTAAVISLDVSRSLVAWSGEVLLLPQLQVKY